jgi:hypothetical protein
MSFANALKEENNQLFEATPPLDDMLTGTCTYQRILVSTDAERDSFGNIPISPETEETFLPCAVQPQGGIEKTQLNQLAIYDEVIYIAKDDIDFLPSRKDRIKNVVIDGVDQNLVYDIQLVMSDGGPGLHWKLGARTTDAK